MKDYEKRLRSALKIVIEKDVVVLDTVEYLGYVFRVTYEKVGFVPTEETNLG